MLNVVLFILGYFLTRKENGKSGRPDDNETSGGSGISSKTWDRIILGGLAIAAYFVLRSSFNKYSQQQAFENIASDPNALIAQQFKTAFEPYGEFLGFAPGTDTNALFALAPTIKDWKGVISSYQQLYTENLTDRLQKELSSSDLVKFYSLLGQGSVTGVVVTANAPAAQSGTATTAGNAPSSGQYSLPGYKDISGQKVVVLSKHLVYLTDSFGSKHTFNPGDTVGTAVGWTKVNGQVRVVYSYRPYLIALDEIHTVDAYAVQLK